MWKYAAWAQDDWKIGQKLTLNLGARYDLIWNAFAQNVTFLPFEVSNRPQDANNIQPASASHIRSPITRCCVAAQASTTTMS
jgi:outer membrane receptor protein involved in Fe transport